jgi:hypothetical protein
MAKAKIVKELLGVGVGVSGKTAKKAKRKAAQDDQMARAGKRYRARSVEPKGSTASTTTTSRTNTRKENEFQKLSREYDGLKRSAKRAEVEKGSDSKYYKVIQERKPKRQRPNLSEVEIDTSNFGDVSKAGRLSKGGLTKNAKPKPKPTPPEDMGAVARGNRMSKMEAGAKKAMGRKAGGSLKEVPSDNSGLKKLPSNVRNKMGYKKAGGFMKKKGYKAGGSIAKPRGVGCAMRGYGKAMKG